MRLMTKWLGKLRVHISTWFSIQHTIFFKKKVNDFLILKKKTLVLYSVLNCGSTIWKEKIQWMKVGDSFRPMDVIGPKVTQLTLIRAEFWISNGGSVGPFVVVVSSCPTRGGVLTSVRRIERRKRSARSSCVGHSCTRHEGANVSTLLSKKGRATEECALGASAVAQLSVKV